MTNIGVTLTADDQQLIAILNRVEGKLDSLGKVSSTAMNQTSVAAAQAAGALKNVERQAGMTEKAMNAALRTVPAQFTDIVTSLQGGQPVLHVLLQQGGQLKDTFNGIIPAARALGGYIWGLINPYTVLAAVVAATVAVFYSASQEASKIQQALIMSGGAANITANQMNALAESSDAVAGTQSKASDVLLQMAAAGVKGAMSLQSFTNTAIQLERSGGPAVEDTVKAFASLGKEPVQASLELNKTTNFLTLAIFEQIKALEDQGRAAEAASVAQTAFDDAMKARIPQMEAQLNDLGKMWRWVADGLKEVADGMKGLFRVDSLEKQLKYAERLLEVSQKGIYSRHLVPERAQAVEDLKEQLRLRARGTAVQQEQNEKTQAAIKGAQEIGKFNEMTLGSQQKIAREIQNYARSVAAVRADGGVVDDEQIAKVTAAIVEKYKDKTAAVRTNNQEIEREIALMLKLSGFTTSYAQDAAVIDSLAARGKISRERAIELQRELLEMQPGIKAAAEEERKVLEARNKVLQDAENDVDAYMAAQLRSQGQAAEKAEDALRQAEAEFENQGKLKSEIAQVTLLRLKDALASEEQGTTAYASIYRQIEAYEKLVEVLARGERRDTAAKAAAEAAAEWKRTWDGIADGLSEALIQGFKGGAAGAADFKRQVERTLRSVFIKPMVDNAVKSILGSVQLWVSKAFDAARGGPAGATSRGGLTDLLSLVSGGGFNLGAAASNAGVYSGAAYGTGFMSQQSQMLAAQEAGMSSAAGAAGIGSMVSAAMPYVAVAIAGSQLAMKDQAAGFTARAARETGDGVGGKYGVGTVFAETANVLKKLGLNDKWADILSMSTGFSKVFGRSTPQATDQGISGTIGGGRANLQAFQDWKAKGGLFRSDKTGTNTAALEQAQQAALNESAKGVFDSVAEWASVLKLPAKQLSDVTQDVRVSLGNDGEKNAEAIGKVMNDYREALAKSLGPAIEPLRKFGETASAALERLSTLQTFSNDLNSLGGVFSRLSGLSVNARESFIGMVGGMEALRSQAKSFVENFYKREEIAGIKAREIQDALRAVGITGDVNTRDQFRALVEGSDINTEAGRLQLATLLQAQGSFVDVADYLQEVGGTLSSIAAQAPQMGAIGGILSAPEQAQLDAINSVTSAVNEVRDAIIELGGQMGGTPQSYPSSDWEVNPGYSTSDGP